MRQCRHSLQIASFLETTFFRRRKYAQQMFRSMPGFDPCYCWPCLCASCRSGADASLAYEGLLTESNALVTGTRPFVFSILDANANELWNSGTQNLSVVEGLYGVVLGATGMPAIPSSLTLKANLHLHILADGVPLSPDISLIPTLQSSTSWSVIGPFFGDISGTQQESRSTS
jgi:hypothetical protein